MGFKNPGKGPARETSGGAQNVYLPQIDEGEMGEESPVQKNKRKVMAK